VRLAGQFAVSPLDGETTVVKLTVPVNPLIGVMVMVELPVAPVLKSAGEVAVMVKSTLMNVKVAVVECIDVPGEPAPLVVTMKVPNVDAVHDRLEVPVPLAVSDTGVTVNALQVKPAGRGVSERATAPTKLNVLVRVIVEVIDEPAGPLGDVALIVKSPT